MGMPTVISVFAGCGGSSLGYGMAGFRELLAIDFDRLACETFAANFPDVPVWQKDVCGISAEEILAFCKIEKGELDVLDGSPPCQGFSLSGKRRVCDLRNDLFREYVRLIDGLRPKAFVMENVRAMAMGSMKGRFREIILALKSLPYRVECRNLNAMWYGIPQSRERLFFIGIRNDLKRKPVWPVHTIKRPITIEESFRGLGNTNRPIEASSERHSKSVLDAWHKSKPGQSLRKACKFVGSFQSCRIDKNKVSPTLVAGHRHWHYAEPRYLTDLELKRICSFPDDFVLAGSKSQRVRLLGNSVMPLQMKAIAETIRERILGKKRKGK